MYASTPTRGGGGQTYMPSAVMGFGDYDKDRFNLTITAQYSNQQALFIAQRILDLREEGMELHEIAVLYRAHYHAMEVQMELTRHGIPFSITSGLRFFSDHEIAVGASYPGTSRLYELTNGLVIAQNPFAWRRMPPM